MVTSGPTDAQGNGEVAATQPDDADATVEPEENARAAAAAAEAAGRARESAARGARADRAVTAPAREHKPRRWPWRSLPVHPSFGAGQEAPVTFSDLVRAHRAWEQELYEHERRDRKPDKSIEREFHRKWRQFEARYGVIDDAYWSVRDASAVALTVKHRDSRWRPTPDLIPRFHRATDWATRDEPDVAAALDDCETLAVRVEEILRGPSELIALRRIQAVASHLLGLVDREWGRRPPPASPQRIPDKHDVEKGRALVAHQRKELELIERFYDRVGNGQARILFFWGMAQGLLALTLLTAVVVGATWLVDRLDGGPTHWGEVQLFVISVIAGAVGAILSVLSRMASLTRKFALDHELGRKNVRWVGIYRPFVGGAFGVASFLLLASGILQTKAPGDDTDFAYYGILALFSGFFERFTKLGPGGAPTAVDTDDKSQTGDSGQAERS